MRSRWIGSALALAALLATSAARADRVALLPSRGGLDPAPRAALDGDLARGLAALGHTLVPAPEVLAAIQANVPDGVADTPEEYRAVGTVTRADWVIVGSIEPAVTTSRVEVAACFLRMGRVESAAREVSRGREGPEVQEVLAFLVRPEGIGVSAPPWEQGPPRPPPPQQQQVAVTPPPPPAQPEVPVIEGRVQIDYMSKTLDVWPAYSAGRRPFLSVTPGFAVAAVRPKGATGSPASMVASGRFGYAAGDRGLEPFVELGGNLVGPRALWFGAGLRWMLNPTLTKGSDGLRRGVSFFMGPEITAGGFVRLGAGSTTAPDGTVYSAPASVHPVLGAALDFALAATPAFQLEANVGNLRWVYTTDGSILLLGATLGATYRF